MSPQRFAFEVGAWILPSELLRAARRFDADPADATSTSALYLMSDVLESDREAGLRALIETFLENFRISNAILDLLPSLGFGEMTPTSREWLHQLRFSGCLRSVDAKHEDEMWPVLQVIERDAVLDFLRNPLLMLTESVNVTAPQFKEARKRGFNVFLRSSINGALGYVLESHVAEAYGVPLSAPQPDFAAVLTYRALSFSVRKMPDATMIDAVREAAESAASLTLAPP